MHDAGSEARGPERESVLARVAVAAPEARAARPAPEPACFAAVAAASGQGEWVEALLDALEGCGLRGVHVRVPRDDGFDLLGSRGLSEATEGALRRGERPEAPRLVERSMPGESRARVGWIDTGAAEPDLDAFLAAADGALCRLRLQAQGEGAWRAIRSLELAAGGAGLVENIAVQLCRVAGAGHVEVRFHGATGAERSACSSSGSLLVEERSPCCERAAAHALRLPLRHGESSFGEVLLADVRFSGAALHRLRAVVGVAAIYLEGERLREEVALRAREETRIRNREERFEMALANAPIVLALQDRALRYTWIHGMRVRRKEEILGRTDAELLAPAEARRLQILKQRAMESGEPVQAEVTLTIEGQQRTWQLTVDPVRDPWQAITGVATAAVDVTARAREAGAREQLLLEREDERSWLLSVIERSPVGILLVEMEGEEERITANRRAAELLGHPVDPVRARKVIAGRLCAADGTPLPLESLPSSRALRGERVSMEESILRRLDGTQIPIVVSAGPIVDAAGRQAGAVVTFDDISPFKELERMREEWTSLITHDLRQPITSISGFAGVLAEHPDLPPHLRSKVVHIVAAARRLGRMTADLLEASRLESNQLALEMQPTDLAALVREVIERLAVELQDHPVRVVEGGALPLLVVDPERIEQVLGNLLSNAAKYSPPGSPIVVELGVQGDEVVVGVINEGDGLRAEELATIFRRFHRSDSARRSRVRGLGLGLYIARGLVEAHGGRIWAETEPGRSVTFRIALPAGVR